MNKKHALYRQRTRAAVLALLGGKCVRCNNDDQRVLDIDHVNPPVKKSMRDKHMYLRLAILRGHKPLDDFQLLCCNCHRIKTLDNKDNIPRHKQGN